VTSRSESESIITMSPSSSVDSMSLEASQRGLGLGPFEPAPFIIPVRAGPVVAGLDLPVGAPALLTVSVDKGPLSP